MKQEKILSEIKKLADQEYKEFHSKLCPNQDNILGVRVPVLRNYAKELVKQINVKEYLESAKDHYYEEVMLQGMIIGLSKMPFEEKLVYIQKFVPKIDNWAICDIFCANLKKDVIKNKDIFWDFILPYAKAEREFEIRFSFVCMMDYFIEEEHLLTIFQQIEQAKKEEYYVKMAIAWLLSVAFIKMPEQTIKYLENNTLDDWTYNKALQKILESYRVDQETKDMIRNRKRK